MSRGSIAGIAILALLLSACGVKDTEPALRLGTSTESELREMLLVDLAVRGIDPDKAVSMAPRGIFSPTVVEGAYMTSGEPSEETPQTVGFYSVATYIAGDCDFNGEVNISDISRLAGWMSAGQTSAAYRDPLELNGQLYVPGNGPALSDGDRNGELTVADIAPIGSHYGETLSGWHVYVNRPSDAGFVQLKSPSDPEAPYFIERSPNQYGPGGSFPVTEPGTVQFYVVPFDERTGTEGAPSKVFGFASNQKPLAGLTPPPSTVTTADSIELDGTASNDPDGENAAYRWLIYTNDPSGDNVFSLEDTGNLKARVRFLRPSVYNVTLEVTDNRGAAVTSTTYTVSVAVGGERSAGWQFSTALPGSRGATDLQEIAGRAALITTNGYVRFTSAPPDGNAWTEPVQPIPNLHFITVGPSLTEVAGCPAVAGAHFYSVASLNGGAPLEYARAVDPAGSAWPLPVELDRQIFGDGLIQVGGEPYLLGTRYPFSSSFWIWHGNDPNGTDMQVTGEHILGSGELDGYEFSLRSSGSDHYVVNRDNLSSEVYHSTDAQNWMRTATLANVIANGQSVRSNPYILGSRLALVWNAGGTIYFTMALDTSATQWIPIKKVVTDALVSDSANPGSDCDGVGVTLLDGAPVIAYSDKDYTLRLVRATNSNGTNWAPGSSEVISSYGAPQECDLAVIAGRPAVSFENIATGAIEYARKF